MNSKSSIWIEMTFEENNIYKKKGIVFVQSIFSCNNQFLQRQYSIAYWIKQPIESVVCKFWNCALARKLCLCSWMDHWYSKITNAMEVHHIFCQITCKITYTWALLTCTTLHTTLQTEKSNKLFNPLKPKPFCTPI